MNTIQKSLLTYRLELAQWRERKRTHELQAVEAGQKAALVEARIAGIVEAAGLLGADIETAESPSAKPKKSRALSGPWKEIMQRADALGEPFGYDDLALIADMIGHPVGRDTLRSQMSGYKSGRLVEPVGNGHFRLTDRGKAVAGISVKESGAHAPKQNEPPEGGSDVDQVSAGTADKVWWANLSRPQGAGESE